MNYTITLTYFENFAHVKTESAGCGDVVSMTQLNKLLEWTQGGHNRKVHISCVNPGAASILQTGASITDHDSAAALTQWLGGVPLI